MVLLYSILSTWFGGGQKKAGCKLLVLVDPIEFTYVNTNDHENEIVKGIEYTLVCTSPVFTTM